MTARVEEISELNISSCMLTEYINGVQTVVNSASPTNYYLQSVIYGDEDNDPEIDNDFFNVRVRKRGGWRQVCSNGSLVQDDKEDNIAKQIHSEVLVYTSDQPNRI